MKSRLRFGSGGQRQRYGLAVSTPKLDSKEGLAHICTKYPGHLVVASDDDPRQDSEQREIERPATTGNGATSGHPGFQDKATILNCRILCPTGAKTVPEGP